MSRKTRAGQIGTITTNFNNILSSADTDVQLALDTIDGNVMEEVMPTSDAYDGYFLQILADNTRIWAPVSATYTNLFEIGDGLEASVGLELRTSTDSGILSYGEGTDLSFIQEGFPSARVVLTEQGDSDTVPLGDHTGGTVAIELQTLTDTGILSYTNATELTFTQDGYAASGIVMTAQGDNNTIPLGDQTSRIVTIGMNTDLNPVDFSYDADIQQFSKDDGITQTFFPTADGYNFTAGTVLYSNGTNLTSLAPGTDYYCMEILSGTPGWTRCSPFANIIYVDGTNGVNDTAERGQFTKPFKTIAAALAVALAGDTILIGPGTYPQSLTIPNIAGLTIKGFGTGQTVVMDGGANPTISYVSAGANALQNLILQDLTLINTNSNATLRIDGYNDADLFLTGQLKLENVQLVQSSGNSTIYFRRLNQVYMHRIWSSDSVMEEVALVYCDSWDNNNKTANFNYNNINPEPTGGRLEHIYRGCRIGTSNINQQAAVNFNPECVVGTIGGHLTDEVGLTFGYVKCSGTLDTLDMTFDYNNGGNHEGVNISKAIVTTELKVEDGGSATNKCEVVARGTVFDFSTAAKITAGAMTEFYMEGATFAQASLVSSGIETPGKIDRDYHYEVYALNGGAQSPSFTIPFVTANYDVVWSLTAPANQPQVPIGGKTNTGFTT